MRFLFIYWGAAISAIFLLRSFLAITEPLVPSNNIWQKSRIHGALAAIDAAGFAPPNGNLILMLGASEAQLGFDPLLFDEELKQRGLSALSYNLALDNVGTYLPLYLERIRMALANRSIRARVIFLDLPLTRFTKRARESFFSHAIHYDVDAALLHGALLRNNFLSTEEKLIVSLNKWVLGERSITQVQRAVTALVNYVFLRSEYVNPSAEMFRRPELHPEPAWNLKARGRFYLNIEQEPELVNILMSQNSTPESRKDDRRFLVRCCDALELNLDQNYFAQVAKSVRALRSVADHVVLTPLPESPSLIFMRTPEARNRFREAYESLSSLSGAELWLAEHRLDFPKRDFFDLSHFRPSGVEKYSKFLASEMPESWLR